MSPDEPSPASILVTFQPGFEALAERDIREADRAAKVVGALEPGLWLVSAPASDLARRMRQAIAVRHLHPVTVDALVHDLPALVAAVTPLAQGLDRTRSFAVQTRFSGARASETWPRAIEVNDAVAAAPAFQGAPYDRKDPAQILSLTIAGERALAGLGDARDNLSSWPGGARRFARSEGSPSRAEHKLLEALEVFALAPHGRALDLGAAPGGWTKVLAERGLTVTAIDPAALDPAVVALPGVHYFRGSAEHFLATRPTLAGRVDLLVSDLRMDARDAARVLVAYRPLLAPGGRLLTTLKLPQRGYLGVLDQAFAILAEGFERLGARQLFHNRSEVTVLLAPRAASTGV